MFALLWSRCEVPPTTQKRWQYKIARNKILCLQPPQEQQQISQGIKANLHLTLNYRPFNTGCHLGCHLGFHLTRKSTC
jgi:hypothetical protein